MLKNKRRSHMIMTYLVCFFVLILHPFDFAQAFTLGKTYDSNNWKEVKDMAPPFLVNWVKRGDFILKTGNLNFELELEKDFLEASHKNLGKFDMNEEGVIVDKENHEQPEFIYGFPFPQIDAQDPKAGEKIMYDFKYGRMRMGGVKSPVANLWVGKGGFEREMIGVEKHLYYQGRPGGPIQNPDNFFRKYLFYVTEPMDLRGTVILSWVYNDERPNKDFDFVSSLRKIRRQSPSNRSDQALGTDMAPDDNILWAGKNSTFNWKLIGETKALCAFASADIQKMYDLANGSVSSKVSNLEFGYEVPGWNGAPWAPASATWSPRPVWIVEGTPKNSNYSYGRQLLYVDKETLMIWFKQLFDGLGQYCKGLFIVYGLKVAPSGKNNVFLPDVTLAVDDKTRHSTFYKLFTIHSDTDNALYLPLNVLGPSDFTKNAAQQLSK